MQSIRDTLITNCITIGIVISIIYCCKIKVERKITLDGFISTYSLNFK